MPALAAGFLSGFPAKIGDARSPVSSPPVPPSNVEDSWTSPFPADVGFRIIDARSGAAPALLPGEGGVLGSGASPRRVRDFAAGRAAAHGAIFRLGGPAAEWREQPVLRSRGRLPLWPVELVGAITHTQGLGGAAVALAAHYLGIGLDLEAQRTPTPGLAERILRPEERSALGDSASEAFTVMFSAKESIYKALNPATGVYLGFQDARVELEMPDLRSEGRFLWTVLKDCGPEVPAGFRGEGRYLRQGGLVLTALWVPRAGGSG